MYSMFNEILLHCECACANMEQQHGLNPNAGKKQHGQSSATDLVKWSGVVLLLKYISKRFISKCFIGLSVKNKIVS